ncbi:hypothetical protein [Polynucleobacter sp. AP-Latsch-80-C2]|jgi:hypothetical protein|uniref:hypothetical protein n=1 Tax=Polynucleobacter sp. AP-Latsch-80-C2 TaxID=2576931 RepID=UPI001C0DBCED|nr:hypothetical protein [Polynucleobacter sp. AP-Latsch-80-C2]MBU3623834.1 hypothetical protein [Polynucleobacter sp. AP-Latsch-80-C2]
MSKLYQSYLGEDERKLLSPIAIPWNVENNTDNSTREYELFKQIALANENSHEPWGLVSRKFTNKSLISVEDFVRFADHQFNEGFDCVFINPMIGIEALHLNVWQQGVQCGHAGLERIIQFLEISLGLPITAPMDKNAFAFCNYFIAKPRFWTEYFSFVDKALSTLDQEVLKGSEVGAVYAGTGSYHRDQNITMKPFVIERLFSTFIQNHLFKVAAFIYDKSFYEKKFGSNFGAFLHQVSALKNLALTLQQANLLAAYDQIRFFIYSNSTYMATISALDDAPDFFLSNEYARLMAEDFSIE